MNKQEAIERIESGAFTVEDTDLLVGLSYTKKIINQIDEPQKVTIPKFVAEWYERNKDDFNTAIYSAITKTYRKVNCENDDLLDTFEEWLVYEYNSILTLVQMQLFGYEVEAEKLYTVEIPNPNSNWKYTFLTKKDNRGVIIFKTDDDCWKKDKNNQLTEAEIRKDFEWAFQWAKEVTDENE